MPLINSDDYTKIVNLSKEIEDNFKNLDKDISLYLESFIKTIFKISKIYYISNYYYLKNYNNLHKLKK